MAKRISLSLFIAFYCLLCRKAKKNAQYLLLCEHTDNYECNKHCDSFHDNSNIIVIHTMMMSTAAMVSSTCLPEQIARFVQLRLKRKKASSSEMDGTKKEIHKDGTKREIQKPRAADSRVQKCLMRKCYLYANACSVSFYPSLYLPLLNR